MKKFAKFLVLGFAVVTLSACSITNPRVATSNTVGTKVGTSKGRMWAWGMLYFKQDLSIKTAAKNGGITKIATVDAKIKIMPLGLWINRWTIVTGD